MKLLLWYSSRSSWGTCLKNTFLNFLTPQLNTWSMQVTPCFLPFFFLSRPLSPGSSFSTYWYALGYSWTLLLDYSFVFALCLFSWLSHPILELNMTPLMPMTTKFMFLSQKVTDAQPYASSLTWMSCKHLEFNMAKLNSVPSFPMPQLQIFSFSRVTDFKTTSLVHLLDKPKVPHNSFPISHSHQILPILCQ